MGVKSKIVIEAFSNGSMIIKEIHGSEKLRTNAWITKEQVSKLLMSGLWNVNRKAASESTLKSRARGMSFVHHLNNIEIAAAVYKPESDESCSGTQRCGTGIEKNRR